MTETELKRQGLICNECWKWYKRWSTQKFDFTRAMEESDIILDMFNQDSLCMDMMYLFTKYLSVELAKTEDLPKEWRKETK